MHTHLREHMHVETRCSLSPISQCFSGPCDAKIITVPILFICLFVCWLCFFFNLSRLYVCEMIVL